MVFSLGTPALVALHSHSAGDAFVSPGYRPGDGPRVDSEEGCTLRSAALFRQGRFSPARWFPMVVQVEQIREGGLVLTQSLPQPFLAEVLADAVREGFHAQGPAALRVSFVRTSGGVLVEGSVDLPLLAPCKRCATEVGFSVPVHFLLNLVPAESKKERATDEPGKDEPETESSGSFELGQADLDTYHGKTIDLDPIVREQVLLALPMHAVCREDCRGLCGMCGQNLNEAACGCESRRVDPRLAVLKDIKLN